jgi:transcriptional regulator with XRE-family HTH domain
MQLKLGDNIKRLRKAKEMTQENLAKLLNISSAAVSKWESNDSYPDITMIIPLAQIFEISIDELMDYNKTKVEAQIQYIISKYHELSKIGKF